MYTLSLFRRPLVNLQRRGIFVFPMTVNDANKELKFTVTGWGSNGTSYNEETVWTRGHFGLFKYDNAIEKFVAYLKENQAYQSPVFSMKTIDYDDELKKQMPMTSFPWIGDLNNSEHVSDALAQSMHLLMQNNMGPEVPFTEDRRCTFALYSYGMLAINRVNQLNFNSVDSASLERAGINRWLDYMLCANPYLTKIILPDQTRLSSRNQKTLAANQLCLELIQVCQIENIEEWIKRWANAKNQKSFSEDAIRHVRQQIVGREFTARFIAGKYNFDLFMNYFLRAYQHSTDSQYTVEAEKYIDLINKNSDQQFNEWVKNLPPIAADETASFFERMDKQLTFNITDTCSHEECRYICGKIDTLLKKMIDTMPIKSQTVEPIASLTI